MCSQLISVVMPAYNAEKTIAESISSVLDQTHTNLQFIVVDDGSTDSTADIVGSYREKDERLSIINQENAGVATARNTGLYASNGSFVATIDADDIWHRSKLQKQLEKLITAGDEYALVYTPARIVDEQSRVLWSSVRHLVNGYATHQLTYLNFIVNSSILFRRKAALEVGGYNTCRQIAGCADLVFSLLLSRRFKFTNVSEYLTGYRYLDASMSSDPMKMLRYRYNALELIIQNGFPIDAEALKLGNARRELGAGLKGLKSKQDFMSSLELISRSICSDPAGIRQLLVNLFRQSKLGVAQKENRDFYRMPTDEVCSGSLVGDLVKTRLERFEQKDNVQL